MHPHKKSNIPFYLTFCLFIYGTIIYFVLRMSSYLTATPDADYGVAFFHVLNNITVNMGDIAFNTKHSIPLLLGATLLFAVALCFIYVEYQKNRHDMAGMESGSAKWNTNVKEYNKKYSDPIESPKNDGEKNMIFTDKISLSMESFKTRRNCNAVILGGSGAGKSRFFVKPNILQANSNYVITDPAGELLESTGGFLQQQGYEIKVFNLVEMQKSNCYNPFHYIRDDQGVLMMINCLIKNTNQDGQKGGDPFWEKSETALLQALCFYLIKYRPVEEQNFSSVMRLLRAAEVDENNPNHKSELDKIFEKVEAEDPNSIALKQYKTFKMGAGKTLKSILISCSVRLTVFNLQQIENLTRVDNIHLEELGGTGKNKKQALFVIIPAADNTFNFLVSMMYSQLFETLYYVAETSCEKQRLPRHVRFLLDEFANIGQIPEFTNKLATMRKYEISCSIILQNLAQIKTMYKDDWETIIGNSDSFLFLGGKEFSTLEYISKELGNQTITVKDRSNSQGKSGSSSKSFKQTSRALMFPDELGNIPDSHCVFMLRGVDPFYDKKYDYTKHPRYKHTGDANSKNKYVNTINNADANRLSMLSNTVTTLNLSDSRVQSKLITKAKTLTNEEERYEIYNQLLSAPNTTFFQKFVISTDTNDGLPPAYIMHPTPPPATSVFESRIIGNLEDLKKLKEEKTSPPVSPDLNDIKIETKEKSESQNGAEIKENDNSNLFENTAEPLIVESDNEDIDDFFNFDSNNASFANFNFDDFNDASDDDNTDYSKFFD